ncbi:MAG: YqaJ viral recombinase family protein [Candidatus Babeliales bacterium]|nr:YqaJ viral recombinase family protein [Candidatus Babeliales bacterium]
MKLSDGIEPFSDKWREIRNGRLTSSLIHKIFISGQGKDNLIGVGGMTYINQKIGEILTGFNSDEITDDGDLPDDVVRGLADEPWALERYSEITGEFVNSSLLFEYNAIAAGTTDGQKIDKKGNIIGILEVKCPRPHKHIKVCAVDAAIELKKIDAQYYHQTQANMLFTGAEHCDFVSYCDKIKTYDLQIRIVRVYPDLEWRKDFLNRIDWIASYMTEQIEKILKTPERNLSYRIEKKPEEIDNLKSAIDAIKEIAQ